MAKGYVETLLNALPNDVKKVLVPAFNYVQDSFRLGPIEANKRATNAQIYWLTATTPSTGNTEFSIEHGLGAAPQYLITGVPLDAINAMIVPLEVSRAADARRVYLTSSSTNATIYLGVGV